MSYLFTVVFIAFLKVSAKLEELTWLLGKVRVTPTLLHFWGEGGLSTNNTHTLPGGSIQQEVYLGSVVTSLTVLLPIYIGYLACCEITNNIYLSPTAPLSYLHSESKKTQKDNENQLS